MASTSETGHAKNVANFKTLISFCNGYGDRYNPYRVSLTIKSLYELQLQAEGNLTAVKTTKMEFDNATNARGIAFADLKSFSTQVLRTFASSDVPKEAIADAEGHNRKIQGKRTKAIPEPVQPLPAPTEKTNTLTEAQEDKHISISQQSYDSLLDNFKELVITVIAQPQYQPNEIELSAKGLNERISILTLLNDKVVDEYTDWSNARINRDKTLYNAMTGLKKTALDVKKYVSGIFKTSSKEYKQISGLKFTDVFK